MSDLVVVDIPEYAHKLIDEAEVATRSHLTAISYRGAQEEFFRWVYVTGFAESPLLAIDTWIQSLLESGQSPKTINRKLSAVKKLFETAARNESFPQAKELYEKIKKGIKGVNTSGERHVAWATWEKMLAMVDAPDTSTEIGKRDKIVLAMLVHAGLRVSEIVNMQWKHLMRVDLHWYFSNFTSKRGRIRNIYIPTKLVDIIFECGERGGKNEYIVKTFDRAGKTDGAAHTSLVGRIIEKYREDVDLGEEITAHGFRRGYAQHLLGKVDIVQISKQLGHASLMTTQQYLKENVDAEALSKVWEDEK